GSDLVQQGGCQQANLLAREAIASASKLNLPARKSRLATETIARKKATLHATDNLHDSLQVNSQIRLR
ncbi:MAG: hypothetical protein WB812_10895, partial [Woeseiaceae bacterium]